MKFNVLTKLALSFLIVMLSVFILLNNLGSKILYNKILNNKIEYLYNEANIISSEYLTSYYTQTINQHDLTTQLKAVEALTNVRTWLVDPYGNIVVDSGYIKSATNLNVNNISRNFLSQSISKNTMHSDFFNEPVLSLIQPVSKDHRIRGFIVLHMPISNIKSDTMFYLDTFNIIYLLFSIILLFVFIYIYIVTIKPLKVLKKASLEYTLSNYDYKIKLKASKDYNELADMITYMANELASLEDYQKKFIANISHDFRSPLTSIKGYAEAMLDGTIPCDSQDKYINIILFETERLNKLTSSLLELNNMESRNVLLDIITFDINSTIKNVAESFEGICSERKISFNLSFSDKTTYVKADIGKIQQVLYNLVDNAIKFSLSNSIINISTDIKGDKVLISVKDYGMGIPKDAVHKVWDRFYKTDSSRGKDKTGTGLGLSITKEIIQAHNENISLISTENVGTEFVFSLQIADI